MTSKWQKNVLYSQAESGMSCHCGLSDAVNDRTLGPQRCCSAMCEKSGRECGGGLDFSNGYSEKCYSVYCVPSPDKDSSSQASSRAVMLASRSEAEGASNRDDVVVDDGDAVTTTGGEGGDDFDAEVEAMLNSIYLTQKRSNVVDIIIACLLGIVILLVLVLLVWAYMFVEAINDPRHAAHAAFYRRLSGVGLGNRNRQQPNVNGNGQSPQPPQPSVTAELDVGNKEANYGSTNQVIR